MGFTSRISLGVPTDEREGARCPTAAVARLVAVEGASTTYGLKDYNGQVVTAVVPSQSRADIQRRSTATSVYATLASVDWATNEVKVVTRKGQILVLEMAPEALRGMPIGDTFPLVFPGHTEVRE